MLKMVGVGIQGVDATADEAIGLLKEVTEALQKRELKPYC